MANGIAYRVFCNRPGDGIILDKTSHTLNLTAGIIGGLAHATAYTIDGTRGMFTTIQLSALLRDKAYNLPNLKLVSIEQTTNLGGGAIWPLNMINDMCNLAHNHGLYVHMDGARLFNATIASGISAHQFVKNIDSVWIDFSKGLGAPFGAVLVGSKEFIEEAWYYKFQQGGTMHQVGMLAAGCLYALEHNIARLSEDHKLTRLLAILLSYIPGITVDPSIVETNILLFQTTYAYQLADYLRSNGIRVLAINTNTIRVIIHMDIHEGHIYETAEAIKYFVTNFVNVQATHSTD
jgi:threonine aldolase